MCTATIIHKSENAFVQISNWDEALDSISLSSYFYSINNTKLFIPKNKLSGCKWVDNYMIHRVFNIPHISNE